MSGNWQAKPESGIQVGQRVADLDDCSGGLGVGQVGRLAVVQLHRLGDLLERVVPPPGRLLVHVVRRRRDGPASLVTITNQPSSSWWLSQPILQDTRTLRTGNGGRGWRRSPGVPAHRSTRRGSNSESGGRDEGPSCPWLLSRRRSCGAKRQGRRGGRRGRWSTRGPALPRWQPPAAWYTMEGSRGGDSFR